MNDIKHSLIEQLPAKHVCDHEGREYVRRDFVPRVDKCQCKVSKYEIPRRHSAYPYHCHHKLVCIDFDTSNDVDVAVYPDSSKIGIRGNGVNKVFVADTDVDCCSGE